MPKVAESLLKLLHRGGAAVFDHSGPLAPRLAPLGLALHSRFFPHSIMEDPETPIGFENLRLYHEGRATYHMQMLAMGMHDREVVALLKSIVTPGMTVLDIGAHIGFFSLICADLVGHGGMVWAFEPLPALQAILSRNIAANAFEGRVRVVPLAVGSAAGSVDLYPSHHDSMLTSLYLEPGEGEGATPREGPDAVRVPCTTLDLWAAGCGWPRVDVIKLDVEGAELAVLTGMRELAHRNPGLRLIVELNERTLAAAGATLDDFWEALRQCGLVRVSLAHRPAAILPYPPDAALVRREIRRSGNDRVNLLCTAPGG